MYSGAADERTKVERERDAMLAQARRVKADASRYDWLTVKGQGVRAMYGERRARRAPVPGQQLTRRYYYRTYAWYQRRVRPVRGQGRAWQRCLRRDVAAVLDGVLAMQALADERSGAQVWL